MVNPRLSGTRCRTIRAIRSHQGVVTRYSEGIVQYEMENLGRQLVCVQWDNGITSYVYPFEIELLGHREEDNSVGI
jgi:hypothetical protein